MYTTQPPGRAPGFNVGLPPKPRPGISASGGISAYAPTRGPPPPSAPKPFHPNHRPSTSEGNDTINDIPKHHPHPPPETHHGGGVAPGLHPRTSSNPPPPIGSLTRSGDYGGVRLPSRVPPASAQQIQVPPRPVGRIPPPPGKAVPPPPSNVQEELPPLPPRDDIAPEQQEVFEENPTHEGSEGGGQGGEGGGGYVDEEYYGGGGDGDVEYHNDSNSHHEGYDEGGEGGEWHGDDNGEDQSGYGYHEPPKKQLPPPPARSVPLPPRNPHNPVVNNKPLPASPVTPAPSISPPPTPGPPAPTPTPTPNRAPVAVPGGSATSGVPTTKTKLKELAGKGWKSLMSKDERHRASTTSGGTPTVNNNNSPNATNTTATPTTTTSPAAPASPPPENPIFGIPLADAARISDKVNGLVPSPITTVIKWFAEVGYDEEGLYRRSGSVTVMQKYIDEFNRGLDVTFPKDEHPINVAGVLKSFLLKLPDPLFTVDYRGQFGKLCTIQEPSMRLATLQFLLSKLPLPNRETIREIAKHMHIITLYEEKNKMNPSNLGTSMGATWSAVMPVLIEAVSLGVFPAETVVFGVPLDDSIARSDHGGFGQPAPFRVCYEFLKPCTYVPYLYKAPVDQNVVHQVINAFNSGTEVSLEGGDPLIVGEVMKHYFRYLPGTIFTGALYQKFLSVKDMGHSEAVAVLKGLMWELPELNFAIIQKLVDHFYEVSQNYMQSKMTVLDIAGCWGEIWIVTIDYFVNCYDELFNQ